MSRKVRLNLDELKVQSFVTTIDPNEQAAMYGMIETGPRVCPSARCTMTQEECGTGGAYCYDTNDGCSVTNTDVNTCVNQTTYCTYYEPQNCMPYI